MDVQPPDKRTIFECALDCAPGAEREAYLEDACAGKPEMRVQVDSLLKAHNAVGSFLDGPAFDAQRTSPLEPIAEQPGTTIGRYKLLERIGEGGFGMVYMAEQQQPIRRKVALKVVKPGMDSRQVLARFEAERQALAIMDHPNIAKVFDAGAIDSGRPYFVMELVKGEPITEFCDRNQLPPRERLELFDQVCHAVQHAHQKGIIHRDIKPTNVLVAMHDTRSVVKVIDFGVAKALGQELTDKTLFTGFAQFLGTPLYMSPEQAGQSSLDIDTRSDIYSLGVLLYELLTGTTPFNKDRFQKAAHDEIRRIIREEEPPKPSTRLSESKETLGSISAQRNSEPGKLTKLVRGDLDWIVMKALEKDRTRRYDTAIGLARDVERYLRDEAVEACPPSVSYRLRKFTRRHRVPLAVVVGFLLLLVIGTIVSTYQAIRIRTEQDNTLAQKLEADRHRTNAERERDHAVAAEQQALSEARKSEQVAAFMTDMLKGVGVSVALGRDTTMLREILDRTAERLNALDDTPVVEAELRGALGNVYRELGDFPAAAVMHRKALNIREKLFGRKSRPAAESLSDLAEAVADHNEAEVLQREALATRRELLGNADPAVAQSLYRTGMTFNRRSKGAEAEPLLRQAVAMLEPSEHAQLAVASRDQLGLALAYQGKYPEAESIMRDSLAISRKASSAPNPDMAYVIHNLAFVLREQGKLAEAEPLFREVLDMRRKLLSRRHRDLMTTLVIFAESLRTQGKDDEAAELAGEVIGLAEEPGSDDIRKFSSGAYYVLGRVRQHQRRLDEAETALRQSVSLAEEHAPMDWMTFSKRWSLGSVMLDQKNYAPAEELFLSGYEDAELREKEFPSEGATRRKEAVGWLISLYEATAQPQKAAHWRAELGLFEPATAKSQTLKK